MLHVKSCNVKHNSESVFRYFASAVKVTRVQNVIEKILMLSVVIEALKSVMTSSVHISKIVVWYTGFTLCRFTSWVTNQNNRFALSFLLVGKKT